jgi:plasmid stability protein
MVMKNVTIALDDETHRLARIRAAELGTSLSAMVKAYLQGIAAGNVPAETQPAGVRELPQSFVPEPAPSAKSAFVPLTKPRQPGAMRGQIRMSDDFNDTPQWLIDAMEGKGDDESWPGR